MDESMAGFFQQKQNEIECQNELNGLKRKHSTVFTSPKDSNLPEELNCLFQPLFCKLCTVQLNSISSSTLHYVSKNHSKKVNRWLEEWAIKTGQACPKREKLFCDLCNINLTSYQHAAQHYAGNKHKQKASKQKTENSESQPILDTNEFLQMQNQNLDGVHFCKICNITVTSSKQLKFHLNGMKHRKKSRLVNDESVLKDSGIIEATDAIKSGEIFQKPKPKIDISIYGTPSGSFYCSSCDLTLDNKHLFHQHLDSKKHLKAIKPQ